MAVYKRWKIWWYKFNWSGETIRESTKQSNKRVAEQMEAAKRTALAKGEVGIKEKPPSPTLAEFAPRFTAAIETLCAEKPATVSFYGEKLRRVLADRKLAGVRLDAIDEAVIDRYKQRRTRQASRYGRPLAPASVSRELATLRRLLRLAQECEGVQPRGVRGNGATLQGQDGRRAPGQSAGEAAAGSGGEMNAVHKAIGQHA